MSGGDLRIRNDSDLEMRSGRTHAIEVIDAHSMQSGDFTEQRQVQGETVFLTPEGAAAFDELQQGAYRFTVAKDPKGLLGWFGGDFTGPKGEQYQGKVGEP